MVLKLRVARPTNNLAALRHFYSEGLGLQELYAFANHGGFQGLMLGHPHAPYNFGFTSQTGYTVPPAPTPENLLVFYVPTHADWAAAEARPHGYLPIPAYNAYWDQRGLTFEDPNGYRVVLQQADWNF